MLLITLLSNKHTDKPWVCCTVFWHDRPWIHTTAFSFTMSPKQAGVSVSHEGGGSNIPVAMGKMLLSWVSWYHMNSLRDCWLWWEDLRSLTKIQLQISFCCHRVMWCGLCASSRACLSWDGRLICWLEYNHFPSLHLWWEHEVRHSMSGLSCLYSKGILRKVHQSFGNKFISAGCFSCFILSQSEYCLKLWPSVAAYHLHLDSVCIQLVSSITVQSWMT